MKWQGMKSVLLTTGLLLGGGCIFAASGSNDASQSTTNGSQGVAATTNGTGQSASGSDQSAAAGSDFSQQQKTSIQSIVRDYILANPEVVVQSIKNFQEQQREQQVAKSILAVKKNADALFNNPKVPSAGNPSGDVQLVEFYDFRCPHCRDASRNVEELIKKNPNLKVFYRDFPIFGGQSNQAAKASIAAYYLNKANYSKFHNALMDGKDEALSDTYIYKVAKQAGY